MLDKPSNWATVLFCSGTGSLPWWHTPLTPVLGRRQRQISLSLRSACCTQSSGSQPVGRDLFGGKLQLWSSNKIILWLGVSTTCQTVLKYHSIMKAEKHWPMKTFLRLTEMQLGDITKLNLLADQSYDHEPEKFQIGHYWVLCFEFALLKQHCLLYLV